MFTLEEPDVKPDVVSYRCLMGMLDETSWPLALELLQFLQTQGYVVGGGLCNRVGRL